MPFPVGPARIEEEEQKLGRRLPAPLRDRLIEDNGCEVWAADREWHLFPVWDPSDRARIRRTANSISRESASARTWRGFPPDAIAIAEDGTGDLLIVPVGSDTIMLWDHATAEMRPVEVVWRPDFDELRAEDEDEPAERLPPVAMINQDEDERYRFIENEVAASGSVWSLSGPDGWATRIDERGRTYLPLFPDAATAALSAVDNWQGYQPRAVEGDALFPWLAELHRANRKLAMFPTPKDRGVITNPARFAEDVERMRRFLAVLAEEEDE